MRKDQSLGEPGRMRSGMANRHRVLALLCVACGLLLAGCNLTPAGPSPTAAPNLEFEGVAAAPFDQYAARFDLTFEGDPAWRYQLISRRAGDAIERRLAIEGVEDTRNPGAVRLVTNEGVTRMRGAGTEERCLQFPERMQVNVTLLTPDEILPPAQFVEPFVLLGQEKVAGFDSAHYGLQQAELDGWQEVQVGLWRSLVGQVVIRYEFQAVGWDPYFNAGWGTLNGTYQLQEVGEQQIEPIEGCQLELPLPADASDLVILPEVVAFSSPSGIEPLAQFFQDSLAEQGWRALNQEQRSSGAIQLAYLRDGERLTISIRRFSENSQVEILRE